MLYIIVIDTKSFRYEDGAWFIQLFIKAVKIAAANKRIEILSLLNGVRGFI